MATIHERIDRAEFRTSPMPEARHAFTRVEAIRQFNRFYTRRIGVLHEGLMNSKFTLTESHLRWELAHRDPITAAEIARDLDPGHLSWLPNAAAAPVSIDGGHLAAAG